MTEDALGKMKTSSSGVRLVLVGGGSVIILNEISGVAKIFRDKNGPVANAIDAYISHISGQYEQIYIYSQIEQEEVLKDAKQKAREQATLTGAVTDPVEVVEEILLAYHLSNATRLRVKVVGNLV
ncbi:hypothetical protein H6H07_000235 [Listeria monocytogenes]|nr:hypothetical protein [Listeria monocytogenes]EAD1455306.1 hypothetical protein [Listeria monocytogenes]EAE1346800.1 hypothetical protein [Listeria monocytogenes]EBD1472101.1 hypothetical protein [Listeria monocytogenes]EGA9662224.1 hypothetical protein [Listeria monocytogenes]